ncbi:transposase [Paenibacillus sp. TRM 82003]|nr:transposase [Paenibacillus sp. TRM 82003]
MFLKHRTKLLKEFMDEAVRLVKEHFEKKHNVTPGIIAGLHTFGSELNFNPHVQHVSDDGGMKKTGEWKTYDYIPFEVVRKQWQTVVLKLIERLQKAYSANGEGFYVHAPKQEGSVKAQLGYIGRYIRRLAIAVSRIETYDGENVKQDGEVKTETVTVEEFIARLIRHIPDENFKTIRYYGVYSRRIKGLCRKMVTEWRREARRWIVKAKRLLKRRTWSERMAERTGKAGLECLKCSCYYEYKGEVCLKEGRLEIAYARC